MRAREFVRENASSGATSSGSIAAVSQPLGGLITRTQSVRPAKYRNTYKGSNPDARR
jgi:hypothetical protein